MTKDKEAREDINEENDESEEFSEENPYTYIHSYSRSFNTQGEENILDQKENFFKLVVLFNLLLVV